MPIHIPTDIIHLYNSPISTGGNSAGNGAPGTNNGAIIDNAHIDFQPTATATAGDVHTDTGNHVYNVDQSVSADTTAWPTSFMRTCPRTCTRASVEAAAAIAPPIAATCTCMPD